MGHNMHTRDELFQYFNSHLPNTFTIHKDTAFELYQTFFTGRTPVIDPQFIVLAGGPGSGKTTYRQKNYAYQGNFFISDPNEVMQMLEGYRISCQNLGPIKAGEKWAPYAQALTTAMLHFAIQHKLNVIYDNACDSQASVSAIKQATMNHYMVEMIAFTVSSQKAYERIQTRDPENNRMLSYDMLQQQTAKFAALWPTYLDLIHTVTLIDTNDYGLKIFTKQNDKYSILVHERYDVFNRTCNSVNVNLSIFDNKNPVALITGASRGIGQALALELAARGIQVIAVARTETDLKYLQSQHPKQIQTIVADISTKKGRKKIFKKAGTHINYLIHNAAIITPVGKLLQLPEEKIRENFETNLIAPVLLTQILSPLLKDNDCRILNISSVDEPVAGLGAYCIAKNGLNSFTDVLKLELRARGIAVARVVPGQVDTSMQVALRQATPEDLPSAQSYQAAREKLLSPQHCAQFLVELLLKKTPIEFSAKDWDIMADFHPSYPSNPQNKLTADVACAVETNVRKPTSTPQEQHAQPKPLPPIPQKPQKIPAPKTSGAPIKFFDPNFMQELSSATQQHAQNITKRPLPVPPQRKR